MAAGHSEQRCWGCGGPPTSRRHHYCDACREAKRRLKRRRKTERDVQRGRASSKARGYGYRHEKLRARWAREVAAGRVDCARCGERILPGEPWDLGHDDMDRSVYSGPEHRRCNRATAGRRPARRVVSRSW